MDIQDTYSYEIEFAGGSIVREGDLQGFSPNRPPARLGRPLRIRLVPNITGRQPVAVEIPEGARPVFHRLIERRMNEMGRISNLVFRFGWAVNGARHMTCLEPESGTVYEETDQG